MQSDDKVKSGSWVNQYLVACVSVFVIALLRMGLVPVLGDKSRYLLFMPAIVVAGYYGGLGPGLLAVALSTLLTLWMVVPVHPPPTAYLYDDFVNQFLFLLVSAAVLYVTTTERREKQRRERVEQELEHLNQALERRVRERTIDLENANQELENFCYSVAHDLRTPMRAIAGNARILMEDFAEQVTPTVAEKLKRMELAATKLGDLVDGLLIYARLAHQELTPEQVDFAQLARETVASARKEFNAEIELETSGDLLVYGDARMLRIAMNALIGNAVKYRKPGEPAYIKVVGQKRDRRHEIAVEDQGIGFENAYLHKVFVPFERLHRDEDYAGVGMGLAHVSRIVQRHDGEVFADGRPGEGSTFGFALPTHVV